MRMLDSIYAANLPAGADAYLGYPDGFWPDWAAIVAKFPGKHIVSLTVYPGVVADGCDCESGDLTIAQAAGWALWRLEAGQYRPIVYAGAANMQPVLAALTSVGVLRTRVRLLSAHYGAGKHICGPGTCGYPQADGTQWRDNAPGLNGSLIDESLLAADFFGPPKPPPPPSRKPSPAVLLGGDDMFILAFDGAGNAPLSIPQFLPDGTTMVSGIRLVATGPAQVQFAWDGGKYEPAVNMDWGRGSLTVPLPLTGASAGKVQRLDKGDTYIAATFV